MTTRNENLPRKQLVDLVANRDVDLLTWDWKESVPIDELQEVIGKGYLNMYAVDDTSGDFYAMVVSKVALEPDDIQPLFELIEDKWAAEAEQVGSRTSRETYRTLSLKIETLVEQDTEIITNELTKVMGKLESLGLDITDWKFEESPEYGKVVD